VLDVRATGRAEYFSLVIGVLEIAAEGQGTGRRAYARFAAASIRNHSYRNLDTILRGIARRVCREIDGAHLCPMDRMNGLAECLFVAARKVGGRFQADLVAMRAGHPGGILEAPIELLCSGRLAEIEASGADGNVDRDLMAVGVDGT
jgi:hypothetical protein